MMQPIIQAAIKVTKAAIRAKTWVADLAEHKTERNAAVSGLKAARPQ